MLGGYALAQARGRRSCGNVTSQAWASLQCLVWTDPLRSMAGESADDGALQYHGASKAAIDEGDRAARTSEIQADDSISQEGKQSYTPSGWWDFIWRVEGGSWTSVKKGDPGRTQHFSCSHHSQPIKPHRCSHGAAKAVVASVLVGTFTGVRYIVNLTDTINTNQQEIVDLKRDLKVAEDKIVDQNTRLTSAESTWQMAENLYRQLADQVREHDYDIKDLNR